MEGDSGTFETRQDAGKGDAGRVKLWLSAIQLAEKKEENWRADCKKTYERYRRERTTGKSKPDAGFNILYSNIATIAPSLYNGVPIPDVRRRYRDKDAVGKIVAQIIERGLSYSIDAYDFDGTMRAVVHNSLLYGRGVPRVRYVPKIVSETPNEGEAEAAPARAAEAEQPPDQGPSESVAWESVECEKVDYRDFLMGPGRCWEEVPWIAYRYRLTREQCKEKFGDIGATIELDFVADDAGKDKSPKEVEEVFKRLTCWEIWDKEAKEVLFIAKSHTDAPLKVEADPLGLSGFFPSPRPLYDIDDPDDLTPIIPYSLYEDQAKELDLLTARIQALVKIIKWRGMRAGIEEIEKLENAKDGELVPVQNWHELLAAGGLEKAFWLMPIDVATQVVKELYLAREQVKQTIFEITGVADVMRGQSDPRETLGAQQLKAQFGSGRLQRRQKEVQRLARDLMRMKAELISEKFAPETLALMTGFDLPTQQQKQQQKQQAALIAQQAQQAGQPIPQQVKDAATKPTWDEIMAILRSDVARQYRIDIETDSTIEPDQIQIQNNMAAFVKGSADFFGAMAPAVQEGFPQDVAIDIYAGFARNFKLGRQAEDAIDRLSQEAEQMMDQPRPKPGEAEAQAAQAEAQAKAEASKAELTLKGQIAQADQQMTAQASQAELMMKEQLAAAELASKERIALAQIQAENERHRLDLEAKLQIAAADREARAKVERQRETKAAA